MTNEPLYLAGPALLRSGGVEGLTLPEPMGTPILIQNLQDFPRPDHEPGWILISDDVDGNALRDLLIRLSGSLAAWSPLLVTGLRDARSSGAPADQAGADSDVSGVRLIPLSPGWPESPNRVSERLAAGGSAAGYLSFRHAMTDLATVRHDINNPLTAALAEVQLTLLDVEPGSEQEESLQVVERQIRRIRDLVIELNAYRTPRSGSGQPGAGGGGAAGGLAGSGGQGASGGSAGSDGQGASGGSAGSGGQGASGGSAGSGGPGPGTRSE